MLINGKGKYDSLKQQDFTALFTQLGLNATNMMKTIKNKFNNIVPLAETLRERLISDGIPQHNLGASMYDKIITIIKKRQTTLNR